MFEGGYIPPIIFEWYNWFDTWFFLSEKIYVTGLISSIWSERGFFVNWVCLTYLSFDLTQSATIPFIYLSFLCCYDRKNIFLVSLFITTCSIGLATGDLIYTKFCVHTKSCRHVKKKDLKFKMLCLYFLLNRFSLF